MASTLPSVRKGELLLAITAISPTRSCCASWSCADTDFHPITPAERIADAVACSPLGNGRPRPPVPRRPVIIDDDVWIGPNATILKGVHIGAGAFIEAGALVTRDVPPRARVLGNPAQIMGEVSR
jgi:acetyltransferase-like isoleucine patch superfamily enzyme